MDVNWRSYRLARRAWSGGLLDIRVAFKDQKEGEPYFVRIHDPKYEVRALNMSQTESQIQAAAMNRAREAAQQQTVVPDFSISRMVESETEFRGMKRTVRTLQPIVSKTATAAQINENRDWHKLRISCKGASATVYWDGKKVLSYSKLDRAGSNDITFWVNYTEALFRNIKAFRDPEKIEIILRNYDKPYDPLIIEHDEKDESFSKIGINMTQKIASKVLYSYAYHLNVVSVIYSVQMDV